MAVYITWPEMHDSYVQMKDNKYLYFGDEKDASIRWDGSELAITAATVNIDGDVTLTGDISIETDDLAVSQGYYVYFDGLGVASEYIYSDTADYLMINATTGLKFALGGTSEVQMTANLFAPAVTDGCALGSTSYYWSDLFLASAGVINFNNDVIITHSTNMLTIASTWSTVNAVGQQLVSSLTTDVRLGSYVNAIYGYVDLQATGGVTGLLGAICGEVVMPTGIAVGTITCFEAEMTCPSSGFDGTRHSMSYIFFNTTGTTKEGFNDYGVLFHFDVGNVAATGNIVGTGYSTLKIGFGQQYPTLRYIPLSTVAETYTTAYPIVSTYGGTALDITSTITVADIIQSITVNDSGTQAGSGRGIGLFIDYVMTNDKTSTYGVRSSRINTNIGGNVDSVICGDWYIHAIDNKTIGWLMGLSMYWENYGSAIGNLAMLDLGMNSANTTVGRHTFIRCREHTGIVNNSSIIRCEGSSAAEYFLWLDTGASGACEMVEAATHQSSATDLKLKIYIEGVGDRYIELVPA